MGRNSDFGECCWCSSRIVRTQEKKIRQENQVELLLRLVGLSPSIVSEEDAGLLCSDCSDLVDSGVAYRKGLEEVKSLLKQRTFARDSKTRSKIATEGSKSKLGQNISKCFSRCYVQLEELALFQQDAEPSTSVSETIPLNPGPNENPEAIQYNQEPVPVTSSNANYSLARSSDALKDVNLRLDETRKVTSTADSACKEFSVENLDHDLENELKVEAGADLMPEEVNDESEGNSNSNATDHNQDATSTGSSAEEAVLLDQTEPSEKRIKLDLEEELVFDLDDSLAEVNSPEYEEQVQLEAIENNQSPAQLPHDGFTEPTPVKERLEAENLDILSNDAKILIPSEETEENDAGGDDDLRNSSDASDVEVVTSDESSDSDDPTYRLESPEPVEKKKNNKSILKPQTRRTRASTKMAQQNRLPEITETSKIYAKVVHVRQKQRESRIDVPLLDTTTTCSHCLLCSDNVPDTSEHLLNVHNLQRQYGNHYTCRMCLHAYLPSDPKAGTGLLITSELEHFKEFADIHQGCSEQLQEAQEPQVCRFCDLVFTAGPMCIIHEYEKHSDALSKYECFCTLCGEHLEHSGVLEDHVLQLHDIGKYSQKLHERRGKLFGCVECSATFWSRRDLESHVRQHSSAAISAKDQCLLCESYSESVVSLYGHYQSKHGLDFIKFSHLACASCFEAFQSSTEPCQPTGIATKVDIAELKDFVDKHSLCTVSSRNSAEQKCRYCLFTSLNARILVDHERKRHPLETMTELLQKYCSVCKLPCSDVQLMVHSLQHRENPGCHYREPTDPIDRRSQLCKCTKCSGQFGVVSRFKAHENMHLLDEKASQIRLHQPDISENDCPICAYSTAVKSVLMLHAERQHNLTLNFEDNSALYSCKHCHTPFEPSNCDQPFGKVQFQDLPAFKSFASEHENCSREKFAKFNCRKCQAKLQTLSDLQKHQVNQHPIKLECRLCSSVFHGYSDLKDHLVDAHSDAFAHSCYRCGRHFESVEELRAHVAELGPVEPSNLKLFAGFACLPCGLHFDSTGLLALHMQEFHDYRKELTFSCRRCSQTFNSNDLKASPEPEDASTSYILNRNKKEFTTFETFTALCTQHHQDCTVQNISERCKRNLDPQNRCYVCEEPFESLQEFAAHLNGHLGVKEVFKCPVCTQIFATSASLQRHTQKKHRIGTFADSYHYCYTCCELWQSKTSPHLGQGELQPADALEFLMFAKLHADCRKSRPIVFQCKFCTRTKKCPPFLFQHEIAKHTKNFPLLCEDCGDGFFHGTGLYQHMKSKGGPHGVPDKKEADQAKQKSRNNEQQSSSNSGDPYKCLRCDRQFWQLQNLKKHEAVHDIIEAKKNAGEGSLLPHVCDECKKDFATATALKIHQNCHRPRSKRPRIFVCHQCGKSYSSKGDLRSHLHQVHSGRKLKLPKKPRKPSIRFTETEEERRERLLKRKKALMKLCPECGKQFVGNTVLMTHMNTHTGERPFACTQCDKTFAAQSSLQIHMALHQEKRERNVPCPHCDKMFFRKCNAEQHVRVFHNKLPWPSKIRSYKKWTPKNPEALAASGIEYQRQDTDKEDTSESD